MTTEEELVRKISDELGRIGTRLLALRALPFLVLAVHYPREGKTYTILMPRDRDSSVDQGAVAALQKLMPGATIEIV